MNRLIRGMITGGVVGAAVGLTMLFRKKNSLNLMWMGRRRSRMFNRRAGNTFQMVRDQAMHWTSNVVRQGTGALLRRIH